MYEANPPAAIVVITPIIESPDDKVNVVTPSVEAILNCCPSIGLAGNVIVSVMANEPASCISTTSCFVSDNEIVPLVAVDTCFIKFAII